MSSRLHKRLIEVRSRQRDESRAALLEQDAVVEQLRGGLRARRQQLLALSQRLTGTAQLGASELRDLSDDLGRARLAVRLAVEALEAAEGELETRRADAREASVELRVAELADERARAEKRRDEERREQSAADDRAAARLPR